MKYLFFVLLSFPMLFLGQKKVEIWVTDGQNQPVPNTKVNVFSETKQPLQNQFTDENGKAIFEFTSENRVKFVVHDLEFDEYSESFQVSEIPETLHFTLKKHEKEIEEVVINKQKPVVQRKIDRLEFNVENSNISSLNAWEILKKTPGVTVINNAIKIKGASGILVTINDKKVMLSPEELQNLLENTQGDDIRSVEVITNPPAKYEASGSAVLNIVMKKNKLEGYKGMVSTRYLQSKYAKGNLSTSHQYKKGKFSSVLSYTRGGGNYLREGTDVVNYAEDGTSWKSIMNRKDKSLTQNSLSFNLDYESDSLTTLSLNYRGYFNPKTAGVYDVPTVITNSSGEAESSYRTVNDHHWKTVNNTLSFQADRKFSKRSSLSWISYFATNAYNKTQDIQTHLNFVNEPPSLRHFLSIDHQNIELYSTQLDYQWKTDKTELEAGTKYSFVKTSSSLGFSDNEFGELEPRPDKSNVFDYKEHNFALYSSFSYNLEKWDFKGGLRAENTVLEGIVSEPYEVNENKYWEIFPTFYAQYTTENKHQFGFSYGKRISRPTYSWLNPAKSYYNLFSYFQGDPKLKATIVHNLNFTYNFKEWNFDFYYRKEVNPAMEISFQEPSTNQLIYHFTNIRKGEAFGLDFYKDFQIKPWWSLSVSETLEHNENYFLGIDQNLYKNKITSLNSNISATFTLDKESGWNLQVGNFFHTGAVQGNLRISGSANTYLVMNMKFAAKKWEASLYLNDIFRSSEEKITTKYANQDNYFLDYRDTRSFSLTLKYNFGNQKLKAAKSIKKTEEQERM